jgi:hypothetical protein
MAGMIVGDVKWDDVETFKAYLGKGENKSKLYSGRMIRGS